MAGEKHKQEVWSEFPQSSLRSREKDAILLQGSCQVELMEQVPNGTWREGGYQSKQPISVVKGETLVGWLLRRKEILATKETGSNLEL